MDAVARQEISHNLFGNLMDKADGKIGFASKFIIGNRVLDHVDFLSPDSAKMPK
jgi:hypothetical protein